MPMPGLQFLSLCVSALVFLALQVSTAVSNSSATYPDFETLQKQIEYQFHSVDLLRQAMTHPSYSIENNHALSLLGLHAIESAAALRLLSTDRVATAADVEAQIKKITSKDACVSGAKGLLLEKLVRVAPGTNATLPTVVCTAYRAMFGAIAVDAGGVDAAVKVLWKVTDGGFVLGSAERLRRGAIVSM